jgi:hypothetical protein
MLMRFKRTNVFVFSAPKPLLVDCKVYQPLLQAYVSKSYQANRPALGNFKGLIFTNEIPNNRPASKQAMEQQWGAESRSVRSVAGLFKVQ